MENLRTPLSTIYAVLGDKQSEHLFFRSWGKMINGGVKDICAESSDHVHVNESAVI
jgi:hypothetical protein